MRVGESLPYGTLSRTSAGARPVEPATGFQETLEAAQAAAEQTHVVKRGDTLSQIVRNTLREQGEDLTSAAIYEGVRRVAEANGLNNPNLIRPGQKLDLAALTERAATAEPAVAEQAVEEVTEPAVAAPEAPAARKSADTGAGIGTLRAVRSYAEQAAVAQVLADTTESAEPAAIEPPLVPVFRDAALAAATTATPSSAKTRDVTLPTRAAVPMGGPAGSRDWADFQLTAAFSLLDAAKAGRAAEETNAVETAVTQDTSTAASPWQGLIESSSRITSDYGTRKDPFTGLNDFHSGIDLAAPFGSRVHALREGTVAFSGWQPGYGKVVTVRHDDGTETLYGHNATNLAQVGERVTKDSVIALLGNTGRSTGPHLHFEARVHGKSVDPVAYLRNQNGS